MKDTTLFRKRNNISVRIWLYTPFPTDLRSAFSLQPLSSFYYGIITRNYFWHLKCHPGHAVIRQSPLSMADKVVIAQEELGENVRGGKEEYKKKERKNRIKTEIVAQ